MKTFCSVCGHVFDEELTACPKCGTERAKRLCVRCRVESASAELYPETAMYWPTGVDYMDSPEPANNALWVCHECEDSRVAPLYWPAFGFMSDESATLASRYDGPFRKKHKIRNNGWLN